ncbi:MAG TPA: flagellin, partial [Syntrophales bacterium]|nr:flagellin [Syntrophales bacterium]
QIAEDAGYKGTNLLGGNNLTVQFNEDGSNLLTISGFDASTASLGIDAAVGNWSDVSNISGTNGAIADLDGALNTLRAQAKNLSSNLNIITTRSTFTQSMINVLTEGATNLTAADTNEEGANMLMLQVRQSLGTTALSLSAQAAQSVLRLF